MIKSYMNMKKYRKLLAHVIAENIDTFEPSDLFCEFTETEEMKKLINKLPGDCETNPEIALLEEEGHLLIEQTLRNLQIFLKSELPLWLITPKATNALQGKE